MHGSSIPILVVTGASGVGKTTAVAQMDTWAAYLRGQADALALPVIDTSRLSSAEVAAALSVIVEQLLSSEPE